MKNTPATLGHDISGFIQAMEFWENYGILKTKFHIWKNWNLSKTAVPMEKLWNFRNGGKKCVLSFKNGGKICPDFEMWFQCLLLRLSLNKPSSTNLPGYSASLGRVNTC